MRMRIANGASIPALAAALGLAVACSSGGDPADYVKQQAKLADKDKPKGSAIKVETAVPGGTKIPCDQLLDAVKFGELMGEKDGVTVSDQTKGEREATSVCSVRKGGEPPDEKAQERMSKTTLVLGVIAGDEICNVAAFCSLPPDPEVIKAACEKKDNTRTSNALGVYACVQVVPKGADDSYTYQFVDPDSKCTMRVRAGPSVNDEAVVQLCAKSAMELIGADQLQQ